MNASITCFSAFLCAIIPARFAAAQEWQRQSPYPADADLAAVHFISETNGWIAGDKGILMGTADGGHTWSQPASVPRDPGGFSAALACVEFVDDQHGFATGNAFYRTTNGGTSWEQLDPVGIGSVIDFEFLSPLTGFAWNRRAVSVTSNGGSVWTEIVPYSSSNFIMHIDWSPAGAMLLAGRLDNQTGVFRSTDGGEHWERVSATQLDTAVFVTETEVLGANNTSIYRSTDGGITWTERLDTTDPLSQADVVMLTRVDDDSFAGIGFDGRIWISNDSGQNWTLTKPPTGLIGGTWSIQFPTPDVGYAAGAAGIIYKSVDGGHSWEQISNGAARTINWIAMHPSGVGVAVGDRGLLLRTTDFGDHWAASGVRGASQFWHIDRLSTAESIDADTFVIGGRQGHVFRTDDAGATWKQLAEFSGNGEVMDTHFLNELEGWVFGTLNSPLGFIDHTNDGGQTWQRRYLGEPPPRRGQILGNGEGRAMLSTDVQLFTSNGFQSAFFEVLPAFSAWVDMEYGSPLHGWFLNNAGPVLRTSDGGQTLTEHMLPEFTNNGGALSDWATDLRAISANEVYVSSWRPAGPITHGRVYRSLDGGTTWTMLDPIIETGHHLAGALTSIEALPDGAIWAGSIDGYIFRTGDVTPSLCTGDTNGDQIIDVDDLNAVLSVLGAAVGVGDPRDIANDDGQIDADDLNVVLANWQRGCP